MVARGWLAVVIVAASLAGCIGDEADPIVVEQALDPDEAVGVEMGPSLAMDQDRYGAEPNIAIAPDGTLFITAPAGLTDEPNQLEGAAWLWRSTDGGESWDTLRRPADGAPDPLGHCSCDADVITSPDGWVYYSDWWISFNPVYSPGNYLVERSSDGGESWESSPVTIPRTQGVDRQWLVAGQDGFVGLFYAVFANPFDPATMVGGGDAFENSALRIEAVFSDDHGQTWGMPTTVVPRESGVFNFIAHPRMLSDGTIIMPYGSTEITETFWRDPSTTMIARSHDQGASWDQVPVAGVPGGYDGIWPVQGAVDEAGTIHVAWQERTGDTTTLWHAESMDGGDNWSPPSAIRADGTSVLPWVAARGDGQVAVGFYGSQSQGDPVDASNDTQWFAYIAERSAGNASFSVAKVDETPVKIGPLCPRGGACEDDRELLDYVSLDYAPDGRIHFAYARSDTVLGDGPRALVYYAGQATAESTDEA